MKRTLALIFWWGVVCPSVVFGQEESGSDKAGAPLSLTAAVKEALSKNADIRVAEARLAAAQGAAKALSSFQSQPQLSLDFAASTSNIELFGVVLEQQIPTGGKQKALWNSGEARAAALEAELLQCKAEVAAQAARAYLDFWAAAEAIKIARARAEDASAAREAAEKRSTAGDLSALEVLLAQAEEERAQAALSRAQGELEAARAAFAAVLGRRPDAPLQVLPPEPLKDAPTVDALLSAAAKAPRLVASQKGVDAAEADLDFTRRSLIPNPTLRVGAGVERIVFDRGDFLGDPGGILGLEETEGLFTLSLSLPVPLLRQGNAGQVNADKGSLAAAEATRDAALRDLSAALLAARARLSAAQEAEALLAKAVPRYEEAEALVKKGYQGGALGIDALLLARERVFGARSDYLAARVATLRARIEIFELLGEIPAAQP